jgi:type VI protein secretion system component Hcp
MYKIKNLFFSMKLKLCCSLITLFFIFENGFAQNGSIKIDSTGIQPKLSSSAILDIHSKTKGVLLPRMTNAERINIQRPEQGLIVYQTDNPGTGLWIFENNDWGQSLNSTAGPQGATGLTGLTGPEGDIGPQGNIGLTGAKGDIGATGPSAVIPDPMNALGQRTPEQLNCYASIDGIIGDYSANGAPSGSIRISGTSFGDGIKLTNGERSRSDNYNELTLFIPYSIIHSQLFALMMTGNKIDNIKISYYIPTSTTNFVYRTIELKDAICMTYKTLAEGGGNLQPVLEMTILYTKIRQTVNKLESGGKSVTLTKSWDYTKQTETF